MFSKLPFLLDVGSVVGSMESESSVPLRLTPLLWPSGWYSSFITLVSPERLERLERFESKEDARCREESAATRKDPFVVVDVACAGDGTRVMSDGRRGWAVTVFEDEEEDREVGETGDSTSELTTSSARVISRTGSGGLCGIWEC